MCVCVWGGGGGGGEGAGDNSPAHKIIVAMVTGYVMTHLTCNPCQPACCYGYNPLDMPVAMVTIH